MKPISIFYTKQYTLEQMVKDMQEACCKEITRILFFNDGVLVQLNPGVQDG